MIRTYLKTALRNFKRQPGHTAINIAGLTLGIASVILIFIWVQQQFSYNGFHTRLDSIYQVNAETHWGAQPGIQSNVQAPLAPELKKQFPEIDQFTRIQYEAGVIKYGDKVNSEENILFVDSAFFDIFSFPWVRGSLDDFKNNPQTILFTESAVGSYFADGEDPIGKIIKYDGYPMTIAGIIKDAPENSSINFNYIVPFSFLKTYYHYPGLEENWGDWYLLAYVTLHENTNLTELNKKVADIYQGKRQVKQENKALLHPFKDMYLKPPLLNFNGLTLLSYIYIVSFVALLILIIACVNFMNLTTASFSTRSKEVGIKKALGSKRKTIFSQFMLESYILAIAAAFLSLAVVRLALPWFGNLVQENLKMKIADPLFLLGFLIIIALTGFIAGAYPSVFLSSFKPVKVLKGGMVDKKGKNQMRRFLVVFQFSLSIIFIIGCSITYKQLKFMQSRDLGFDKEQVIRVQINESEKFDPLKNILLKNKYVENITAANWWGFNSNSNTYGYDFPGKDPDFDELLTQQEVDRDYIETLNIPLVEGSSFKHLTTNSGRGNEFILNQTAIELFDIENPIGTRFTLNGRSGKIIGVMKDAHFRALGREIDPRILSVLDNRYSNTLIRINAPGGNSGFGAMSAALKSIEKDWYATCPDIPFDYQFVDDLYDEAHFIEKSINNLFTVFAGMAIFISCLGLFGLATFMIKQKTKEIGIRKSNGAQSPQIVGLFIQSFTKYVFVAFVLAVPLSWYFMDKWLSNYAFRTEFSWWIFAMAFLIVLAIALVTVTWHSFKAAKRNPVEALRYE